MDTKFIIAQVIGSVATLIFAYISIFKVGRTKILIGNVIINLMWLVHYILMDATSGIVSCSIIVVSCIVFYFREKNKIMSSIIWPILFSIAFIVLQSLFYVNPFSIVIMAGDVLLTIAFWCKKEFNIKFFVFLCAICFLIYNISIQTVIGIVVQSLSIAMNLTYLIMHIKDFKQKDPSK